MIEANVQNIVQIQEQASGECRLGKIAQEDVAEISLEHSRLAR